MNSTALRRAGPAALLATSFAGLTVFAATPSFADSPTFPVNDSMYALPCQVGGPYDVLAAVEPALSEAEALNSGTSTEDCATNAAWDPTNSTGYFESSITSDGAANPIYSVDVSTRTSGEAFQPHDATGNVQLSSFAVGTDGQGYAVSGPDFYQLSMATGDLTLVGPTGLDDESFASLAVDPVNGTLYGVTPSNNLYSIDSGSGGATFDGSIAPLDGAQISQIEFDSSGTLWLLGSIPGAESSYLYYDSDNAGAFGTPIGASQTPLLAGNSAIFAEAGFIATGAAITSASSATAYAGKAFSFDVSASGTGPVFSVSQGQLPAGITLDPATGVISGTTSQLGTYSVVLTASEGNTTLTQNFTLTVLPQLAVTGVDATQGMLVAMTLLGLGSVFAGITAVRRRAHRAHS